MKQLLISLLIISSVVLSGAVGAATNPESGSQMQDLGSEVKAKAALAVSQFQSRAGGRLDYSEKSLVAVEEMLEEAAQYANEMSQSDQDALVALMGSYILAVAHRQHGGKFQWYEQKDQPVLIVGEPEFHVAIVTFDKVRGRLSGDKADNIPFFYQGFSERVRSAKPGTRALYV